MAINNERRIIRTGKAESRKGILSPTAKNDTGGDQGGKGWQRVEVLGGEAG